MAQWLIPVADLGNAQGLRINLSSLCQLSQGFFSGKGALGIISSALGGRFAW